MSRASTSAPGQNILFYSCIARDHVVLCDHTAAQTNAQQIAQLILEKIKPTDDTKLTYVYGEYLVHYITRKPSNDLSSGMTYLVIAGNSLGRRVPFSYLLQIEQKFLETFPTEDIMEAPVFGMKSFTAQMKQGMESAVVEEDSATLPGGSSSKAKQVKAEIDQVKNVMVQNIERVLERGERIDLLVDKTDHMSQNAFAFRKRSAQVRRQMWWKNTKLMVIISLVIVLMLFIIIRIST